MPVWVWIISIILGTLIYLYPFLKLCRFGSLIMGMCVCVCVCVFLGKGVPNVLAQDGCRIRVPDHLLPGSSAAADTYMEERGTSLTRESVFGTDPFNSEEDRIRAETEYKLLHSDVTVLFDSTVNKHYRPFQDALIDLINITRRNV